MLIVAPRSVWLREAPVGADTQATVTIVRSIKPPLAVELIEELLALGFRFSVVLADSLYEERGPFIVCCTDTHSPSQTACGL